MNRRRRVRVGPALVWCAVACCAGVSGCANFFDDMTAHGETFNDKIHRIFGKDADPLVVLQDSKDGSVRAKAFHKLLEPKLHGGTDEQQELYVKILVTQSGAESTAPARIAAVETLGSYKDPRAVKGLEDAYYQANRFVTPEVASVIRCQVLEALGATGQPAALELLTKVLKSPAVDKNASEAERQRDIDERCAAVRSLGNFQGAQPTTALVGILRVEREGALRGEAATALVQITGANLPEDAKIWDEYLHDPSTHPPTLSDNLMKLVPVSFRDP